MTVVLEATDLFGKLVDDTIDPSFVLTWGPYAFFVSGLLQLIAGLIEASRNNIYGGTAFLAFGSFWLANGTKLILQSYFPDQIPFQFSGSDPGGNFVRNFYIFMLACALFKQTLTMNKLSSLLTAMLMVQMFFTSFAGWSVGFEWLQLLSMICVAVWAFYVFLAEFTNQVYNRQVFDLYPWNPQADPGIFSAAGCPSALHNPATLRAASQHSHTQRTKQVSNFHTLRSVTPTKTDQNAVGEQDAPASEVTTTGEKVVAEVASTAVCTVLESVTNKVPFQMTKPDRFINTTIAYSNCDVDNVGIATIDNET